LKKLKKGRADRALEGKASYTRLERDPERWEPVFPRDKRESVCAEITLKQTEEIMMRFNLIAS
jgi:hypothetical protein